MRSVAPVLVVLLFVPGCTSGLNRPVHEVTAKADAQGVQRLTITTHTFYFEPNRIVVKANQPVELKVRNGSWLVPHNLSLKASDGGLDLEADVHPLGGSRVLRFTPTRPGEYSFYCDKDEHMKKGMTGTVVVTP